MRMSDFLAECNPHGVPEADFALQFCNRCHTPECSRARGASFDRRVSTWEETLFKNPPQLDPNDPRYQANLARNFKDLAPPTGVILPGPPKKSLPVWESIPHGHDEKAISAPKTPSFSAKDHLVAPEEEGPSAVEEPVVAEKGVAVSPQLNTSRRSGIMLPGAPQPEPVVYGGETPAATTAKEQPVRILQPGKPVRLKGK